MLHIAALSAFLKERERANAKKRLIRPPQDLNLRSKCYMMAKKLKRAMIRVIPLNHSGRRPHVVDVRRLKNGFTRRSSFSCSCSPHLPRGSLYRLSRFPTSVCRTGAKSPSLDSSQQRLFFPSNLNPPKLPPQRLPLLLKQYAQVDTYYRNTLVLLRAASHVARARWRRN
jgi:hypothetical protein